ncbi:MAG: PRD domain-containing protein [Clostridium sp.]|nr:PRD domain-containing protein [Clostridium sp.]
MDLTIRLDILKKSGMLSESNYNKVIKVIEYFHKVKNMKLVEENSSMFITHLCSALERIDKNENVNVIDEEVLNALKLEEKYIESMELVKDLKGFLGEIPKEEVDFIVMHVCTLLTQV